MLLLDLIVKHRLRRHFSRQVGSDRGLSVQALQADSPPLAKWREIIAVGINGVIYSLLVFGLLAIWKWSGKAA